MLRQILASGIAAETEVSEEESAVDRTQPEVRKRTDLLFPFGILLLILSLADIAIRSLRWKDVLMVFRRV